MASFSYISFSSFAIAKTCKPSMSPPACSTIAASGLKLEKSTLGNCACNTPRMSCMDCSDVSRPVSPIIMSDNAPLPLPMRSARYGAICSLISLAMSGFSVFATSFSSSCLIGARSSIHSSIKPPRFDFFFVARPIELTARSYVVIFDNASNELRTVVSNSASAGLSRIAF